VTERRDKRRVSLREAAVVLGISEDAVTMRIRHGTLRSEKIDDQVHVWLDEVPDTDQNVVYPHAHIENSRDLPREKADGIQELWEQVHHFRGILAQERHARHRTDAIITQLTQANAALASGVPEFEASAPPFRPEPAKSMEPKRTQPERSEPDGANLERVQPERGEPEKQESHLTTEGLQKGSERPFTEEPKLITGAGRDSVVEDGRDVGADSRRENLEVIRRHTSRLERRLGVLERRQHRPEPISVLKLLITEEIQLALSLTERAGVLPNGEVRHPEAFRETTPREREALEHWRKLCGEPLDHLELAEELLDRMGEAYGWRSHEAVKAALLVKRLEMPDESPWFVGKIAEAVLNFYAVLEEHPGEGRHPKVRGAVRRLERLKEMDRIARDRRSISEEDRTSEVLEAPQEWPGVLRPSPKEGQRGIAAREGRRKLWWMRWLGG
jgi:hypothetical protein